MATQVDHLLDKSFEHEVIAEEMSEDEDDWWRGGVLRKGTVVSKLRDSIIAQLNTNDAHSLLQLINIIQISGGSQTDPTTIVEEVNEFFTGTSRVVKGAAVPAALKGEVFLSWRRRPAAAR